MTILVSGMAGVLSGSSGPKHFVLQEGFSEQEAKSWPFKMTDSLEVMVPYIKQSKIKFPDFKY